MSSAAGAPATAVRRLHRDLAALQKSENPQLVVRPSNNIFQWHFIFHSLPNDTPYHGGCYHGKMIFPEDYPHKPPSIMMVTASGRLEVGMRLCLSMTDYHPELWNPAWSAETILIGLLSFFVSDKEAGKGSLQRPLALRRELAKRSWEDNAKDADFRDLFPDFLEKPEDSASASTGNITHQELPKGERRMKPLEVAEGLEPTRSAAARQEAESHGQDCAEEEEEETKECWICRETSSTEPLIQPCACRGSMSHVHASCAQQWIDHHRQDALNIGPPVCSVCQQPYSGREVQPGPGRMAAETCSSLAPLLLFEFPQTVMFVLVLLTFMGLLAFPGPQVVITVIFYTLFMYRVIVLSVSISKVQLQQGSCLRVIFVLDPCGRRASFYTAEVLLVFLLYIHLYATGSIGNLDPVHILICVVGLVIPMTLACLSRLSLRCCKIATVFMLLVIVSPLLWLIGAAVKTYKYGIRRIIAHIVHPLDFGWHFLVGVAGLVLLITELLSECSCTVPLLCLWGGHGVLLALGLLEQTTLQQLQWHKGQRWSAVVGIALFNWEVATILLVPENATQVRISASGWFILVASFVVKTNWSIFCMEPYQAWAHRNGQFILDADSGTSAPDGSSSAADAAAPDDNSRSAPLLPV